MERMLESMRAMGLGGSMYSAQDMMAGGVGGAGDMYGDGEGYEGEDGYEGMGMPPMGGMGGYGAGDVEL